MKKWLIRAGVSILLLIAIFLGAAFWSDQDTQIMTRHIKNDSLPTIKAGWSGNPIDQKGRFMNDEFPFLPKALDLLKWRLSGNKFGEEKENDTARLEIRSPTDFLNSETDGLLWLGHASFFIRIGGTSILTDPVFGKPPFVREYIAVESPLEKIPHVDYVLVSHDHRDHTDENTLRSIAQKFPKAVFMAGLGMENILNDWKTPTNEVQTAGWFQQYDIPNNEIEIFFVPLRHWARRGLFDINQRLWGGFVIRSEKATIFFGGDSGYGRHYGEVGAVFPNIDYFLIGIGAYEPRWFMEPHHNNPSDAIKAFRDSGARTMVPMHYGRFDLSDEPPSWPLKTLLSEIEKAGIKDLVRPLAINESLDIQ